MTENQQPNDKRAFVGKSELSGFIKLYIQPFIASCLNLEKG